MAAEERSQATALYGALQSLGLTLGPALCGLLLLFGPAIWVLLANGVSFVASAALLAGVPLGAGPGTAETNEEPAASAWEAARQGARHAAHESGVGSVLLIGATSVLCGAVINVVEPVLATGPLHAGRAGFSILVTAYGVGLVAGSVYTSRLGSRIGTLRINFLVGVAVTGVAMLACAAAGNLASALAPFAIAGFANAVIIDPESRLVQELVAEKLRGRVFGLRDSAESACFVLAFAAGALLSVVGPRAVYLLSGVLLIGTSAVGWRVFKLPEQTATPAGRVPTDAVAIADLA